MLSKMGVIEDAIEDNQIDNSENLRAEGSNCIKKRLQHSCFPVKFSEIFKNTYFEEHLRTTASQYEGKHLLSVNWNEIL